ncbi:MAG: hypothetical protein EOO50_02545 [Flavobacterium sp.]|uniref:hypothetical protein n=1 Tax=Flavobacterium sp. TaxID=239 RepID=UPI00121FECB4|nr:hypothetical protein [Flavobacterium sp.]RZJ68317.1 MAG: hypothetical protein EOO50_02545 [Flavobacterium sp.]
MILKIISDIILLAAAFTGFKQGLAVTSGKFGMLGFFGRFGWSKTSVFINGISTIASALLVIFPKIFVGGNFLMAAGILLIIGLEIFHGDLKGAVIVVPILLSNLALLRLKHPFSNH